MRLPDSPQIEHIIAQNIDSTLNLDWYNLLLSCGACNRAKSDKPCPPHTHYLPHVHNTYLAFNFRVITNPRQNNEEAIFIIPNRNLTAAQITKAQNTIQLCRLHEDTTANPDQKTDRRWEDRFQAFISARVWRAYWDKGGNTIPEEFIKLLMTVALSTGFFSIWFHIFHDVTPIKKALVEDFPGTALNCFDANNNYNPIWRNQPNEI